MSRIAGTPRLLIHLPRLVHNFLTLRARCERSGIMITAVLKGLAGDLTILRALADAGLTDVGDSRLANLRRFNRFSGLNKMLLRLPARFELERVLTTCTVSLHTETEILDALERLAASSRQTHQIMLMIDLGDLREGINLADFHRTAVFCQGLKQLRLTGLGTNFSCFAGVKPTEEKLVQLIDLAHLLRDEYHLPLTQISGGNSSSLPLMEAGRMPEGINHLRVGEAILLGRETLNGTILPGLYSDAFEIEAEVVQAQFKPGQPDGEIGHNALGQIPVFPQLEAGYRALLNIGQQDTALGGLKPLNPEIIILGGSSDYLVVAGKKSFKVGERLLFRPSYWSLLAAMTTPYIRREYFK